MNGGCSESDLTPSASEERSTLYQEDVEEEARRAFRRSVVYDDEIPPPLRGGHAQTLHRMGTRLSVMSHATAETGGSYGATTLGETGTQASNDSDLLNVSSAQSTVSEDADKGLNTALLLYTNEKYGPTVVKMWKPMFRSRNFALKGVSIRAEQETGFLNPLRKVFIMIFLISERRSTYQRALLRDPKFHAFVKRAHEIDGMCILAVKLPVSGNVKKLNPQKLRLPEHFPPYRTWIPFHRRGAEQEDMKSEIWFRIEKRSNKARKRLLRVKSLLGLPGPLERNDLEEMTPKTRDWLLQDFERWKSSDDRVFVLMAYSGMGKSAFMNSVVKKYKVDVAAEIRVKGRLATDSSAKYLVQFIANQMGQSVKGFAKRKKRGAMHDQLEADREEAQLQEESVAQSFERLVCKRARALTQKEPKIVFIDGLDQCQPADERDDLVEVLSKWAEKTPSWLRLFVTSSPAFGIPQKLGHLTCVTLDMDDERNTEDLRIYASSVLKKLSTNMDKSVAKVIEEACGWFQYAKYLLDELTEQAQVQDGETDVLNVLTKLTPHTLLPRVRKDYKRHFSALSKFLKAQKLDYGNILAPIVSARVPVPLLAWRELSQMTANHDQFLRRYLVIERGYIRLLHHSMRTWIESVEQGDNLKVNLVDGHKVLAAWCFQIEKALQNSRNHVAQSLDEGEVNPNEQEVEEIPREAQQPQPQTQSQQEEQPRSELENEDQGQGQGQGSIHGQVVNEAPEMEQESIDQLEEEVEGEGEGEPLEIKPIVREVEAEAEEEEEHREEKEKLRSRSQSESFGGSLGEENMDDSSEVQVQGEDEEEAQEISRSRSRKRSRKQEALTASEGTGVAAFQHQENPMDTELQEHGEAVEIKQDRDKLSQRFAHEQILYHLSMADRFRDAQSFILDFQWLLDRVHYGGIEGVLYDAEKYVIQKKREHVKDVFDSLAPRSDPIEWDVEIVVAALRLSRHTLRKDYRELPSQLLARISDEDLENKSFYASLKEYTPGVTWWRPLKPTLFKPTLEVNRIWKMRNKSEYDESGFASMDVSCDLQRVAIGCLNCTIYVYRMDLAELEHELSSNHADVVCTIRFSKDGLNFASGDYESVINVWSSTSGECLRTLEGHKGVVWSLCFPTFSADHILSASQDGTVWEWFKDAGEMIVDVAQGIGDFYFSRKGEIAIAADDHLIHVYNKNSGHKIRDFTGHKNEIRTICASHDEAMLASGGDDDFIIVWKADEERIFHTIDAGGDGSITCVCFSLDDTHIYASSDTMIRQWRLKTSAGELVRKLTGHAADINEIKVVRDALGNEQLLSVALDETLIQWYPSNKPEGAGVEERLAENMATADIGLCLISPQENYFFTSNMDAVVTIWGMGVGDVVHHLRHAAYVDMLACSYDEAMIACGTGRSQNTVSVWNTSTGQVRFECEVGMLGAMAFAWSSQIFATTCYVNGTVLYETTEGLQLRQVHHEDENVFSTLAFTPADDLILGAAENEDAKIWKVDTGEVEKNLNLASGGAVDSCFSVDAEHLAIATATRAYAWKKGEDDKYGTAGTVFADEEEIVCICFSQDCEYLVAMTEGWADVLIWDTNEFERVYNVGMYDLELRVTSTQSSGFFGYPLSANRDKDGDNIEKYVLPRSAEEHPIGFSIDMLSSFCEQFVTVSQSKAVVVEGAKVHFFERVKR